MNMRRWTSWVMSTVFFFGNSISAKFLDCTIPDSPAEHCSDSLADITVVESGEFIIAKLQCYGCPTTARLEKGGHEITHEDNALFFNISLSQNHTQLLLNSEPIFPSLASPPPNLYAPQIPLNYSFSSLSTTIKYTQQPCGNLDGKCDCIADNLGGVRLSYDYYAFSSSASGGWIIRLDALGGHNGYMADPYVEFGSPLQKVLQINFEQHQNGRLEILDSTRLVERIPAPADSHQKMSTWDKIRKFFGFENDRAREDGHTVYLIPEWDYYGRPGTLKHLLHEVWANYPWGLVAIIVGSVLGGLSLLYGIFRFVTLVYRSPTTGQGAKNARDEEYKLEERGRLLDGEEEDTPPKSDEQGRLLDEDDEESEA